MTSIPATASSVVSSQISDPTTPAYSDDLEWITAYLTIHSLSTPSYRYPFLLWIVVAFIFLLMTSLHWSGVRGGFIGALWSQWALRRRTWRKKHALQAAMRSGQPHKQPFTFPSNAQLLTLSILSIGVIALCLAGPDYINPSISVWNFADWTNSTTNAGTLSSSLASRATVPDSSTLSAYSPQYTIQKSFWTSSARFGNIAFALFPLCVLFALKAPPFAVFAIPFMIQLHFDKLALMHKWSGRIIWLISAIHVILWSVQLSTDVRSETGEHIWSYAWQYQKFIYGWVAFGLLTLVNVFSLSIFRTRFYDFFYLLHVLLVPTTIVFSALHHPPVWWWLWAALCLWVGERLWRLTWWFYINGLGTSSRNSAASAAPLSPMDKSPEVTLTPRTANEFLSPGMWETRGMKRMDIEGQHRVRLLDPKESTPVTPTTPSSTISSTAPLLYSSIPSMISTTQYIPPTGYAHATLLPGRTVCLRILTPGYVSWAPGQHFLVGIPSISMFSTHPFTCASICDDMISTDAGRLLVFIVRSKTGWTRRLWEAVEKLLAQNRRSHAYEVPVGSKIDLPGQGVILRAYVDGPFGSCVRARWGDYSSAVIVAGGSGISFAVAIVQFLCLCLLGRDSRSLGARPGGWGGSKFHLNRIRLVWIVREFSHIQWCTSLIRRCMSLASGDGLEVSIFVTNSNISSTSQPVSYADSYENAVHETIRLVPPAKPFVNQRANVLDSPSSTESDEIFDSDVDLSYYFGGGIEGQLGHEEHILDYTNFDGDDDTALPGEQRLSRHLKKEGKVRRERSLRASRMLNVEEESEKNIDSGHHRQTSSASEQLLPYLHSPSSSISQEDDNSFRHSRKLSVVSTDRLLSKSHTYESSPAVSRRGNDKILPHDFNNGLFRPQLSSPGHSFSRSAIERPRLQIQRPVFDGTPNSLYPTTSKATSEAFHYEMNNLDEDYGQQSFNQFEHDFRFDLDPQEMGDVRTISEAARPGKPRLDRILVDELQRARGTVIVACCGPSSLNALIRKLVAANIQPRELLRGQSHGTIALISEDFEY